MHSSSISPWRISKHTPDQEELAEQFWTSVRCKVWYQEGFQEIDPGLWHVQDFPKSPQLTIGSDTTVCHPLLWLRREQHQTTALIRNVDSARDSLLPQSSLNQWCRKVALILETSMNAAHGEWARIWPQQTACLSTCLTWSVCLSLLSLLLQQRWFFFMLGVSSATDGESQVDLFVIFCIAAWSRKHLLSAAAFCYQLVSVTSTGLLGIAITPQQGVLLKCQGSVLTRSCCSQPGQCCRSLITNNKGHRQWECTCLYLGEVFPHFDDSENHDSRSPRSNYKGSV